MNASAVKGKLSKARRDLVGTVANYLAECGKLVIGATKRGGGKIYFLPEHAPGQSASA